MTTQEAHKQLLDSLISDVVALRANFNEYRCTFPPPSPFDARDSFLWQCVYEHSGFLIRKGGVRVGQMDQGRGNIGITTQIRSRNHLIAPLDRKSVV